VYEVSHRMGKCFVPNALRRDLGSEGIKRPLIRLLFRLTNVTWSTSKYKTVKYPDLPSAMRHLPHNEEFPVLSLRKIWLLVRTTSITKKISDNKKGKVLIAVRHLKQVAPHLNPIFQHKEILTNLSVTWVCLITSWTLRLRTKRVEYSPSSYWNMLLLQSLK
jgi:hypothetical protein